MKSARKIPGARSESRPLPIQGDFIFPFLIGVLLCFTQKPAHGQIFSYGGTSVTIESQPQLTYNGSWVYIQCNVQYSGLSSSTDYLTFCTPNPGKITPEFEGTSGSYGTSFGDPHINITGPHEGGSSSGSGILGLYNTWYSGNKAGTYTVTGVYISYAYPSLGAEYYQDLSPSISFSMVWNGSAFTSITWNGFSPAQAPPTTIQSVPASVVYGDTVTLAVSGGTAAGAAQIEVSSNGGTTWTQSGIVMTSSTQGTFTPPAAGNYVFRAMWSATSSYSASAWSGALDPITVNPARASNPTLASKLHQWVARIAGPVELATGAESFSRPLFNFHGAANWGFGISYNSLLASSETQPGPLGFGWDHAYEASIVQSNGDLIVQWDAVHSNTFVPNSTGSAYTCSQEGEVYDTLVANSTGGWTLTRRDQSQMVFSSSGRLVETLDPHGRQLTIAYNSSNQLTSISDPISSTGVSFSYNSSGFISSITDTAGGSVSFTYDPNLRVITKIVNQDGYQTTFTYDALHELLTLAGNDGTVLTTNTYNSSGQMTSQRDGVPGRQPIAFSYQQQSSTNDTITTVTDKTGQIWVYTSDPSGNLISVCNPLNETTTYTYDAAGDCTSVTDPLGEVTTCVYDTSGNLTGMTDAAGHQTAYAYDSRNNLLSSTDPLGNKVSRTYDGSNNLLTLTDQAGNKTTWTYNQNSQPLTKTLPIGGVFTYTYSGGQLTSLQDPNGVTAQFTYDGDGRILSTTDASGNVSTFTYDAIGNLLSTTDPLSHTTREVYDSRNRLTSTTDPTGAVMSYTYDNNNNVLTVTDPLGHVTTKAYDGNDRLVSVTDPRSHTTAFAYDAAGELVSVTDPTGNVTRYTYDGAGRATATTDALGNTASASYDPRGLLLSATDPLARSSSWGYDAAGRRTSTTDPLSRTTAFTYDAVSRITGVTDPGSLATGQTYDGDGNRISTTDAAGNTITFSYDVGDRLTGMTTAGGKATGYTYDQRGLPSTLTSPSGNVTTSAYDAAGRIVSVSDPVGTITTTRDADGRVLTETENGKTVTRSYDASGRLVQYIDEAGNVIGYAYDASGNLTQLTYPDGKSVVYAYDNANRMTSVTDWAGRVTTYGYDADGRLVTTTRPNGTVQSRSFDAAGELASISETASNGAVIYSDSYTYDAGSRLATETPTPSMPVPQTGQLAQTFDVDNRLTSSAGQSDSFDADGNLISLPGGAPASYSYDARNRLTSAGGVSYTYDCDGNRVAMSDATGTTSYVINPNALLNQVLMRTAPDGTVTHYVYGLTLLYEQSGSTARYYHFDRRGDTVAETDDSANILGQWQYGIYGEVLGESGQATTPFLFCGALGVITDSNGLCYQRSRYYNPSIRRFINQDPTLGSIDLAASMNRFAYANGVPVTLTDPFGLAAADFTASAWSSLGQRIKNGAISGGAGAASGAATGALVGAGVGFLAGGVGAAPGALAGAGSGAIAGGISGFFNGFFAPLNSSAGSLAVGGLEAGAVAGAFGGLGAVEVDAAAAMEGAADSAAGGVEAVAAVDAGAGEGAAMPAIESTASPADFASSDAPTAPAAGDVAPPLTAGDNPSAMADSASGSSVAEMGATRSYTVYQSWNESGEVQYVGITSNFEARAAAHLAEKGIEIEEIQGLSGLNLQDARAVEQTLIDNYGLGKSGGTLLNKINSISATTDTEYYLNSLFRGQELLKGANYPGF